MSSASTAAAAPPEVEYVGFWLRVLAQLIDLFALLFLVVPLTVWYFGDGWTEAQGLSAFAINWIAPGVLLMVFWRARGATPGKMLISAVIVDADTLGAPSPLQLAGRYVGYYVSMFALFVGFVWVAVDARKQGWHDKIARTVVIRRRG